MAHDIHAHRILILDFGSQYTQLIARRVRAFDPFPGAQAVLAGQTIKLWSARGQSAAAAGVPGQVLAAGVDGIRVQTGDGALWLTELQRPGGKRLAAGEFLRGQRIEAGQVFDAALAREPD